MVKWGIKQVVTDLEFTEPDSERVLADSKIQGQDGQMSPARERSMSRGVYLYLVSQDHPKDPITKVSERLW